MNSRYEKCNSEVGWYELVFFLNQRSFYQLLEASVQQNILEICVDIEKVLERHSVHRTRTAAEIHTHCITLYTNAKIKTTDCTRTPCTG